MSSGLAARRYAKALFELAAEEKAVGEVGDRLLLLAEALAEVDHELLASVGMEPKLRQRMGEAIATKVGGDTLIGRFVRLLASRDRLGQLPLIRDWFERIRDRAEGRVRVSVTTAAELSEQELERIVAKFAKLVGKRVISVARVDPDLLGGALVEIEGKVFDGSVRTNLQRLVHRMAGTAVTPSN